jgi:hypothetical protein
MYGLRVATVRNGRKKEKKQKTKIENENDTKTNKTTNEQHARSIEEQHRAGKHVLSHVLRRACVIFVNMLSRPRRRDGFPGVAIAM